MAVFAAGAADVGVAPLSAMISDFFRWVAVEWVKDYCLQIAHQFLSFPLNDLVSLSPEEGGILNCFL